MAIDWGRLNGSILRVFSDAEPVSFAQRFTGLTMQIHAVVGGPRSSQFTEPNPNSCVLMVMNSDITAVGGFSPAAGDEGSLRSENYLVKDARLDESGALHVEMVRR